MVPLAFAFRKLLLGNIPQLTSDDLDRYDSLLALRLDFIHQSRLNSLPVEQEPVPYVVTAPSGEQSAAPGAAPIKPLHELKANGERQTGLVDAIKITSAESDAVIRPFRRRFEALHRLWVARRRLAAQLGTLQPIPSTGAGIKNLVGAVVNYQKVQIATFGVLVSERLKDFFGDIKGICLQVVGKDRRYPHGDIL